MLTVYASKGPSSIHGLGLIAREFIPEGSRVWEFDCTVDLEISPAEMRDLTPITQEQILSYAIYCPICGFYILSGDDDRFVNHSDNPNTAMDSSLDFAVATRDIQIGEEITMRYDFKPTADAPSPPGKESLLKMHWGAVAPHLG